MPVTSNGVYEKRSTGKILEDLIKAIKTQFGENADVSSVSTFRLMLQAYGVLPLAEMEDDQEDIYLQSFYRSASGDNLNKILEPLGNPRKQATRAKGTVDITLKTGQNNPSPFFAAGSLIFIDSADRRYTLDKDVLVDGTTSTEAEVRAQVAGTKGNIDPNEIVAVVFTNDTVKNRWLEHVDSFSNPESFKGGQDRETDIEYRARHDKLLATIGGSSIAGIEKNVADVDGVNSVTAKENDNDTSNSDIVVIDVNQTGTASESIDTATNTKIAQKFTIASGTRRFIQHIKYQVTHGATAPKFDIRIETDNAGAPSGTLAAQNLRYLSHLPTTGALNTVALDKGSYLDAGTYWIVFECTQGDCTFDGGTGGTADQVKFWNGTAWGLSATVENLNHEIIAGIPPHGFRVYVDGGLVDDIAQAILEVKPAGIPFDGESSGSATDRSGTSVTVYFDRPTLVNVYIDITVKKNSDFTTNADHIKDIIVEYVGGTDTKGEKHAGLAVEKDLVKNEVVKLVLDEDKVLGTEDVTAITLGTAANPTGTTNLVPNTGEKFTIDPANINVTLE